MLAYKESSLFKMHLHIPVWLFNLSGCRVVEACCFTLCTHDIFFCEAHVFDTDSVFVSKCQMESAVFALHQIRVFVLLVVGCIFVPCEAFASFHDTDHWPCLAAVLRKCNSNRATKSRPCYFAVYRMRRMGWVVSDGNSAAGQFQCTDTGVIVRKYCRNRFCPCITPVCRFADINIVSETAAEKGIQVLPPSSSTILA